MLKRVFFGLVGLFVLALAPLGAYAQPANISQKVAVCDPKFPTNCQKPGADGSTPISGSISLSGPLSITPAALTPLDFSSTVATGGTFQTVFTASSSRTSCFIQNPTSATEPLYVHWTAASPTLANSASLGPGASFSCSWNNAIVTSLIQVTAATTAHAYVATGS
jgi:hypothetical protein